MKKLLFFIVGVITIISCNEPDEINYEQKILGRWACDYIDGKANSTQSFHIIDFQDNNKLQWSEGVEAENGKTDWHKHPAFSYRVTENIITYEGQDAQGNLINAELSINSITETSLTYYIKKLTINNTNVSDNRLFKLKKISSETPQLEGIWFGKEVSPGTQAHDYYWQFFNDGKFDFYYYDEATKKYKKGKCHNSSQKTENHNNATHHRDWYSLKFSSVWIVHNIFCFSDVKDVWLKPNGGYQSR